MKTFKSLFMTIMILFGSHTVMAQNEEKTGFLGDYSKLKPYPQEVGVSYQFNKDKDFSNFKKVIISDVQIHFSEELEQIPLTNKQVKQLEEHFRQKTRQFISKHFHVVREPGRDVLLLRLAITDIIPNEVYFEVDWDIKKPGFSISYATVEADFNLSTTGERIFAVVDERTAQKYEYIIGINSWWHTDDLYVQWSDLFSQIMDEQYERN